MDYQPYFYKCKRIKLYLYLLNHGFQPIMTIPDSKRNNYNNWLFIKTPELVLAVNKYYDDFFNNSDESDNLNIFDT